MNVETTVEQVTWSHLLNIFATNLNSPADPSQQVNSTEVAAGNMNLNSGELHTDGRLVRADSLIESNSKDENALLNSYHT